MNLFDLLLGTPILAGLVLAVTRDAWRATWINSGASMVSLVAATGLAVRVLDRGSILAHDGAFFIDAYNVFLVALTAFVAFTTTIFSGPYMRHELETGRVTPQRLRLYHAMYQFFIFAMFLGLTTNNLGILWVSLELATLATVLLVSLYRTQDAIAAAWKYFIICGVGIALALFGTVLIFSTSSEILGHENAALTWTILHEYSKDLSPRMMIVAFAFLMVGYGTKVGLVPMHTWLPDAHGEGPTPVSAVLSGLLLNVALYALVRCKILVDGATQSGYAGYMIMGFGLLSLLVAALALHQQQDIKRMFSFSSIEHMGLMTFAFGLATPLANFAGLLHMTVHSLVKSGIFFTVGHAAQSMGTQQISRIRGLIRSQPAVGWGLVIGTLAIAGFPPFAVFTSEFLLMTATLQSYPWIVLLLLLGLAIAFAALLRKIQPMVFDEPPDYAQRIHANMLPLYVHLGLALLLGFAIPGFLADWYDSAAALLATTRGG